MPDKALCVLAVPRAPLATAGTISWSSPSAPGCAPVRISVQIGAKTTRESRGVVPRRAPPPVAAAAPPSIARRAHVAAPSITVALKIEARERRPLVPYNPGPDDSRAVLSRAPAYSRRVDSGHEQPSPGAGGSGRQGDRRMDRPIPPEDSDDPNVGQCGLP